MKIRSTGPSAHKRARTLVLQATSDVEAALLYQMMVKLRETPLGLGAWQTDVLRAVNEIGDATTVQVAEHLGESVTAINNRMSALWKMGLLTRQADNFVPGGRRFVYAVNVVEEFEETEENN